MVDAEAFLERDGQVEAQTVGGDGVDGTKLAGGGLAAVGFGPAVAVGIAVRAPIGAAVSVTVVGGVSVAIRRGRRGQRP